MSALRRAIHLIIALALTAVGFAEFVYLYFFAEAPRGWITVAAGLMGPGFWSQVQQDYANRICTSLPSSLRIA
jgi:hypothetical protein